MQRGLGEAAPPKGVSPTRALHQDRVRNIALRIKVFEMEKS
ncbi:hypothetical protein [Moorena sp. SIO3H5]|nr:hypothetical protein [Moorena sp. SIO3H5]